MKTRIIGAILVLVVLGILFILTESALTIPSAGTTMPTPATQSSSESDFKNLKIN